MRACPGCHGPHPRDAEGRCAQCHGAWFPALADADGRRAIARGPLTPLTCADCGAPLKSLDIQGPVHEGDLFWGLETARPQGSCVVEGCPRCGGVWADAANVDRAGGTEDLRSSLVRTIGPRS